MAVPSAWRIHHPCSTCPRPIHSSFKDLLRGHFPENDFLYLPFPISSCENWPPLFSVPLHIAIDSIWSDLVCLINAYTTSAPSMLEERHICNSSTCEGIFRWWHGMAFETNEHFLLSESSWLRSPQALTPLFLECCLPNLSPWLWENCEISRTNTVAGQPQGHSPPTLQGLRSHFKPT